MQMGFGEFLAQEPPLRVIDDYGPIGKGASAAHTVRCENGSEYLLKGPSFSPGHPFVAANELIAVRLGRHLGLPVLDHAVAEMVGNEFFASQLMTTGTFAPAITESLLAGCSNRDRVHGIAVFDIWLCNVDRHHENLIVRQRRGGADLLLLNDHSHLLVLPGNGPPDLAALVGTPAGSYFRLDFLREALDSTQSLEDALAAAERVSDEELRAIVRSVPKGLLSSAHRTPYEELLIARRPLIRPLIAAEPDLFPNLA